MTLKGSGGSEYFVGLYSPNEELDIITSSIFDMVQVYELKQVISAT